MAARVAVTCTAPVNIAVLKYWGKRNEELLLPLHASLSVTLDQKDLKTVTSVASGDSFAKDRIWLNGKEENTELDRIQNVFREIRKRIVNKVKTLDGSLVEPEVARGWKIHVVTNNNFPTASGLASSASGYACLVYSLAQLFQLKESYDGEFSSIARVGSGSACRSLYGGFVKWEPGTKPSGEDSIAVPVATAEHWPLEVLIVVVSDKKKDVSSTSGMQTSVETSTLIQTRAQTVVPERLKQFEKAIKERDFATFAELTMKDSNQFHAICLDTYPPIFYMNDVSKQIIQLITRYNAHYKTLKAAYTFDAGPNACIYLPKENVDEVKRLIQYFFPTPGSAPVEIPEALKKLGQVNANVIDRIIHTRAGPGPQVVGSEESLLDPSNGLPKSTK